MSEDLTRRAEVFVAVDEERQYQEAQSADPSRPSMRPDLTVGEHILAIDRLITDMRSQWYSGSPPHTPVLDNMRKIAALAFQCMEQHGIVRRQS